MKTITGARVSRAAVGVLVAAGGVMGSPGVATSAQALPTCAKVFTVTSVQQLECVLPPGFAQVRVSLVGSGGGGAGPYVIPFSGDILPGGGGGGGALVTCTYTPTAEARTITATVRAGGTAGTDNRPGGKGDTTFVSGGGNVTADNGGGGKLAARTPTGIKGGRGGAGGSNAYPQTYCYDQNTGTSTAGRPGTSSGGPGGQAGRPLPAGCPADAGHGGKGGTEARRSTAGRPGCIRIEFLNGTA